MIDRTKIIDEIHSVFDALATSEQVRSWARGRLIILAETIEDRGDQTQWIAEELRDIIAKLTVETPRR